MTGAGGFTGLTSGVSQFDSTNEFNSNSGFQSNPLRTDGFTQKSGTVTNTLILNRQMNPYEQKPSPTENLLGSNENLKPSTY